MSRQRKADLLLVLATGFWGVSYYLLDLCLTELQPLTLNSTLNTVEVLISSEL